LKISNTISLFNNSSRHVKKKLLASPFHCSPRLQQPELVMGIPAGGLTAEQKAAYDRDGVCPLAFVVVETLKTSPGTWLCSYKIYIGLFSGYINLSQRAAQKVLCFRSFLKHKTIEYIPGCDM
jgi:hypothetical protein